MHGVQKFPNWCTHLEEVPGDCGCAGPPPSEALQATFVNFTHNELGHLDHGVLQCPQEATDQWLMYHVPCSASSREKTAVIEMVRSAGWLLWLQSHWDAMHTVGTYLCMCHVAAGTRSGHQDSSGHMAGAADRPAALTIPTRQVVVLCKS